MLEQSAESTNNIHTNNIHVIHSVTEILPYRFEDFNYFILKGSKV